MGFSCYSSAGPIISSQMHQENCLKAIRNEEGKIMLSKVKRLMKSLGFRIEGDSQFGYKLEIGEPSSRKSVEPIDWKRAFVDPTYKMPETVVTRESTLRYYKLTKDELIAAAKKYLYTTSSVPISVV